MSRIGLYDTSGELLLVRDADGFDATREGPELTAVEVPDAWPREMRWDPATLSFVADLGWLRSQRWSLIRAARDAARAGGCDSAIGRVDTGGDSLILANGASSAAMAASAANQPFSIGWTRADNTTVELDGSAMIALGLAIVAHVGACHAEGVARRAALDAAVDEAAIAAVPVEGGWPGE